MQLALAILLLAALAVLPSHPVAAAFREESSAKAPYINEKFIGWKGESYRPYDPQAVPAPASKPPEGSYVECVSWKPRACIYHNFITDAEARHLLRTAAPHMKRSTVVNDTDGSSVIDDYRTSYGTFLNRKQDPVLAEIERRISQWVMLPESHQEDLQVLRYGQGQYYKKHYDSLEDEESGPRVCTILMYLRDVEEGGETCFPDGSTWLDPAMQAKVDPTFSECAKGHVAFKPKRGDAFIFWSNKPDGTTDPLAMHTGCPVVKGVKWVAIKWIHGQPFRLEQFSALSVGALKEGYKVGGGDEGYDPAACADLHPQCKMWAEAGECRANARYMLGDGAGVGACRVACGACVACVEGDKGCRDGNRRRAGYLVVDPQEMV